jgi:hypothetical protein
MLWKTMASGRTTTALVSAGDYTYLFINKDTTTDIDFIRFNPAATEDAPVRGKVGISGQPIQVKDGPIAALAWIPPNSPALQIVLYYYRAGNPGDGDIFSIAEIKLDNAALQETNPGTSWREDREKGSFYTGISQTFVDTKSLFAATLTNKGKPSLILTRYRSDQLSYLAVNEKNRWISENLDAAQPFPN